MNNLSDPCEYRVLHHPEYEGFRGEYELQWCGNDGEWQNLAFSHDIEALARIVQSGGA